MNYSLTPLSQLDASTLADLAALHHSVMHTLLSELGLPVVLRYYQVCQSDPSVIGLCAFAPTGEIMGWAIGSLRPDELNARLRQPLTWFAGQMLRLAFTHPAVLWQLAASALSARSQMDSALGAIELTYIGVAASTRGQGLGQALLAAFMDASRAAGYGSVALSVETDNAEAIALYTKAGFKVTRSFREGRFERQRLERTL